MIGNKTIWVMMIVSLISVVGIYYTYHYGTSAMQGVWSGTFLTSTAAYMLLEDERQREERRRRHDGRYEENS